MELSTGDGSSVDSGDQERWDWSSEPLTNVSFKGVKGFGTLYYHGEKKKPNRADYPRAGGHPVLQKQSQVYGGLGVKSPTTGGSRGAAWSLVGCCGRTEFGSSRCG